MILQEDILHIARLARIALSPGEAERYRRELAKVLEFVAVLEKADTTAAEPLTGGTGIENALRDDSPGGAVLGRFPGPGLVQSAPAHRDGYVAVKAVFDRT
ncbi:MAG: hypothetical protein A3B37_03785 [Candidatus Sungbacteria bacterium RIFCSPLOWO2_01_FULL_59_16]|uniref:Aspartyl/glutamyl-tRNA(Asn/Gln) amidotransferase subunit C n=1 Tax=Candidatus Sungbacteria bacterium RIFCSPLOWO2_01_FULL_59_16 TaxID=1802280 RepID=A0A1G2L9D0_9BACT|nr:MAG: hypothetical protein A3B37_03785 [Candidatus Sungbacteria bacterium RIFCSPLOWO2_01_FULL_59_16]